jgi:small multidrug resistance pump
MHYIYLAIAIICEVIATSALKASDGMQHWKPAIVVLVGYGGALLFLSLTVRTMALGVVYAVWSGIGIVLISAIGYFVYKQTLDTAAIIGMGLIVVGVAVLNIFSNSIVR